MPYAMVTMSEDILFIDQQDAMLSFLEKIEAAPYVTLDTEFLRDRTYYPVLCLVQISDPDGHAAAIDPMADGIDLAPLLAFLTDPKRLKVIHAGRQDLEIFFTLTDQVLTPVFDTQIGAAILGLGESIAYKSLVSKYCQVELSKAHQFTDWSRRPLNKAQLSYAISDVTYLVKIYEGMMDDLRRMGRDGWVEDEHQVLTDPDIYRINPDTAWERVKIRSKKGRDLAVLKALAAWRERNAQTQNVPRNRILKDEALVEIAMTHPKDAKALGNVRFLSGRRAQSSKDGDEILRLMREAEQSPKESWPQKAAKVSLGAEHAAPLEMLKMLLRIVAAEHCVSARMIAAPTDLEVLVQRGKKANVKALEGWRHDVFGAEALEMLDGKVALSLDNGQVVRSASDKI